MSERASDRVTLKQGERFTRFVPGIYMGRNRQHGINGKERKETLITKPGAVLTTGIL